MNAFLWFIAGMVFTVVVITVVMAVILWNLKVFEDKNER